MAMCILETLILIRVTDAERVKFIIIIKVRLNIYLRQVSSIVTETEKRTPLYLTNIPALQILIISLIWFSSRRFSEI